LPTIPEISLARKNDQQAAAKLGLFAYHRETKSRVWQSGTAVARSTAKDTWILGAGPFQSGTLHEGVQFAGSEISLLTEEGEESNQRLVSRFREPALFNPADLFEKSSHIAGEAPADAGGVIPASAEVESVTTDEYPFTGSELGVN
jgi:hypothetical protein